MGFLKKFFVLLTILLFLSGCARSLIKISTSEDNQPYRMFGKNPNREFYEPISISDSLIELWETSVNGGFSNSSIVVYDNYVFASDLSGRVYTFNIEDGDQEGKLNYKGAVFSSPAVFRGTLIFPVSIENEPLTEIVYYDFFNGKELQIIEIPGRILTEMVVLDKSVIFCTDFGTVYKYNLTGNKEWETHIRVPIRSSPSMFNNKIIFGNDKGEIIALDELSGDSIYVSDIGGNFFSGSSIYDSVLYIGNENGILYAINPEDGSLIWEFDSGARIAMTPAVDDTNVIFGNLSGNLFSLNKISGEKVWEAKFSSVLNATPLLTDNRIILPDVSLSFHFLDKKSGRVIKTFPLEGRAKLTPVIHKGILYIGYDDGILRAYEFVN
jgi:outer membrane protein assembly factor BamB